MPERAIVERFPIASAPRDGSRIRLFHDADAQEDERFPTYGFLRNGLWKLSHGFIIRHDGRLLFTLEATHWSPLSYPSASALSEAIT